MKSIVSKAIAVSLLMCAQTQARAADDDWYQFAEGTSKTKYFYRASTLKKSGNNWTIWAKEIPSKPEPVNASDPKGKRYSHAMVLQLVNCKDKTGTSTARHEYAADGTIAKSYNWPPNFQPVVPDSIGETLLKEICNVMEPDA